MWLGINTKAEALGRSPLFEGLARGQLERLAKSVEELDVRPGTVLCREDRLAGEFFVIVDGEAEVTKGGEHVRRLDTGDFFGEVAMIERAPRAAPSGASCTRTAISSAGCCGR